MLEFFAVMLGNILGLQGLRMSIHSFVQVMREQLEPEVVVLHFEHLTPDYSSTWLSTSHLTDIYSELLSDVAFLLRLFISLLVRERKMNFRICFVQCGGL